MIQRGLEKAVGGVATGINVCLAAFLSQMRAKRLPARLRTTPSSKLSEVAKRRILGPFGPLPRRGARVVCEELLVT